MVRISDAITEEEVVAVSVNEGVPALPYFSTGGVGVGGGGGVL